MEDFTKCMGLNCKLKENCLRFKERKRKDDYFTESPYDKQTNHCDLFWGETQEKFYKQLIEITKPSN